MRLAAIEALLRREAIRIHEFLTSDKIGVADQILTRCSTQIVVRKAQLRAAIEAIGSRRNIEVALQASLRLGPGDRAMRQCLME